MRCFHIASAILGLCVLAPAIAIGQATNLLATPWTQGFTLSGGMGRMEPGSFSVTGTGDDLNYWQRALSGLSPGATYRLRFTARVTPGSASSTVISGLDACNRDFGISESFQPYTFVFTTPQEVDHRIVRLGQWHLKGTVIFRDASLTPVQPVFRHVGAVSLGAGERTDDKTYEFVALFYGEGSNSARPLYSHTAAFNSNRWVFTGGSEVVYRHVLNGARQVGAKLSVNVNYWIGGECVVGASTDGKDWVEVARLKGTTGGTIDLPASLFPAEAVWIRIHGVSSTTAAGNSEPGAFQVDGYTYRATLDRSVPPIEGATHYLEVRQESAQLAVRVEDVGAFGMGGEDALRLALKPQPGLRGPLKVRVEIGPAGPDTRNKAVFQQQLPLKGEEEQVITLPYRVTNTGDIAALLTVSSNLDQREFTAIADIHVPEYFAANYGYRLPDMPEGALWWCESTYKVSPSRLPPTSPRPENLAAASPIRLSAAARERIAFQIVLRSGSEPGPVRVSVTDLAGPDGVRIPQSAVAKRKVEYVRVRVPTDRVGVAADWPDPLPPLEGSWQPAPDRNNPLWFTISVPADARAGVYEGNVVLQGRATLKIPLRLQVRNFALPATTALRSGFGLNPGNIRRYHNLMSEEALRKVWDLYMRDFAAHRLSPYNPMVLAPIRVRVQGTTWSGGFRDNRRIMSGQWSLGVRDDRTNQVISANTTDLIPVQPGRRYRFAWSCVTERPGQAYEVSIGCHDAGRNWIPNHNVDIPKVGNGEWQSESIEVGDRLPTEARFVSITLRPAVWTEKGENTGTAWFDDVGLFMEPGGHNLVAGGGFEEEPDLHVTMDFSEFDKAARRYLDDLGFGAFRLNVMGLGDGRFPNYDQGSFLGFAAGTPQYDVLMRQYGQQLQDHLKKNGWLSKAYVYWYDEPEAKDYPFVVQGMDRLKKYAPKLTRMLTEEFQPSLFGHVELWCPITPNYTSAPAAARQKLGEEVWWYVCTGPKEPYATLFIDHPAIEMRMWLWQTWKYRVQGILIWETTWWTSPQQFKEKVQNPWEDPMSYVADTSGVWGNGDGRFFYPPNRRPDEDTTTEYIVPPIPSIRWELLSEGIQDWEYFHMLEGLVKRAEARGDRSDAVQQAKRLLTVPDAICHDMTHFTTDPMLLIRHREALARAIESLKARDR